MAISWGPLTGGPAAVVTAVCVCVCVWRKDSKTHWAVNLSSDGVKQNLRESLMSRSGRREEGGLIRGIEGEGQSERSRRAGQGLLVSCCFQHNAITVSPAPALLSPLPLRFNLSLFTFSLPHVSPSRFYFLPAASASLLFYFFLWACLRYKVSLFTMLTVLTADWGLKVRITHYTHTHTFYTPFHLSSPLFHSLFCCGSEDFF